MNSWLINPRKHLITWQSIFLITAFLSPFRSYSQLLTMKGVTNDPPKSSGSQTGFHIFQYPVLISDPEPNKQSEFQDPNKYISITSLPSGPESQMESRHAQQMADIQRDLMETPMYREEQEWLSRTRYYRKAYRQLKGMVPDRFSITEAVFQVENAYFDGRLNHTELMSVLDMRGLEVKQILRRAHLSEKNDLALNYGIQALYRQANLYHDSSTNQTVNVPAFKYDFDDFDGEKDYTKMFASKLLATGKGQCHSMPLVYLMIAEKLGAKSWLSLAPEHSFIQFQDTKGRLVNFETTNGNLVSSSWAAESGYVTAKALSNKIYLDTLCHRALYIRCLDDLLLGYLHKFGYDVFAEEVNQHILQLDSTNLTALIVDANEKTLSAMRAIRKAGSPRPQDLPKYPKVYSAFLAMQMAEGKVDDLGYQNMPKDAYQMWLKSLDGEKKKQSTLAIQERMQQEVKALRKTNSTLHNGKN